MNIDFNDQFFKDILKDLISNFSHEQKKNLIKTNPEEIMLFEDEMTFDFYHELIIDNPRVFEYIDKNIPRYNELEELYGVLTK